MYAQISNTGIVLMVEDCYRNGKQYPLEELYHKDILPLFTEVPDGIYPQIGWKYDGKIFTDFRVHPRTQSLLQSLSAG